MTTDLLIQAGLVKIQPNTVSNSFAISSLDPFYKKEVANRDSARWKKAEFIFVGDDLSSAAANGLLQVWGKLNWISQCLIFSENGISKIIDGKSNCVGVGDTEILEFIRNRIRKNEETTIQKYGNCQDTLMLLLALRHFKARRVADEWQTCKDGYKDVCVAAREYFGKVTDETIRKFDFDEYRAFCLSHTWMGRNGSGWAQLDRKDCFCEYVNFFADLKTEMKRPSEYWHMELPKGVGKPLVSELLMKFHPHDYCLYNEKTHSALALLGMIDGAFDRKFNAAQYLRVLGLQAQIQQSMAKEKIKATIDADSSDADFLTVNEFLFYVATHKDSMKETIMATTLKDVKPKKYDDSKVKATIADSADPLMMRLMSALRTKPFAILAGHSGTGKSRMVRKLAYMTCCDEGLRKDGEGKWLDRPGNFCMIQVKPNWHDNSELLGYYSELKGGYKPTEFTRFICKAYAYPDVPFFVCLDEMNLAPVEHYFAEYLSAIESAKLEINKEGKIVQISDTLIPKDESLYNHSSDLGAESIPADAWIKEHGLTIPRNLFVVGTVNMDETTCQFSRKVLDRAMTIEMAKVDFESFGVKDKNPSFDDTLKCEEIEKLLNGKITAESLSDVQKKNLNAIKDILEKTPFMIAYRFANEYALYEEALAAFGKGDEKAAFDDMVLMKVLPRIAGEDGVVKEIFDGKDGGVGLKILVGAESESHRKMSDILARNDNYLSFWP